MNFVEPIRDRKKITQIKNQLRGQRRYRDLLLFVVGINTALRISDLLQLSVVHFIVELCVEAGLVWDEELYFDSTKVDANASINSMIDRTESEADQHLEELWKKNEEKEPNETLQRLVEKYNGERFTGLRKPSYKRITDEKFSLTDPDAAPIRGARWW